MIATGVTSTSYTDTTVANTTTYDYAVRATSAPNTATSATFLKEDTATEGTWIGAYGSEAYDLVDSSSSLPDATITASGESTYLWTNTTTNTPALQIPGSGYRVAAAWYASSSFTVDVDLTDGEAHDLALYFLDYQGGNGRSEQVTLSNASTGAVLDSEYVSSFSNGTYLQWQISGNVLITFKWVGGAAAVLSGLFVDPPSLVGTSPFSQPLQVTTGNPVDVLTAQAISLSATEGQSIYATIAQFTDSDLSTPASSFTATINWGDWVTSTGTVSGGSGSFTVQASHTYSSFGSFPIGVTINLGSPVTATASTVSTATISEPSSGVSLSSYFNEVGITTTGSSTEGKLGGAGNESYSSTALGTSVTWNSAAFGLGPANANDAVKAKGQTVPFSCTNCSSIELLAAATNGSNQGGLFTIDYSGGSSDTYTLGLSDWTGGYIGAGSNAPGESTVVNMHNFETYSGTTESLSTGGAFLYGYVIPTNSSKTITGLVLPSNSAIAIFSIDEIMQPSQLNLSGYFGAVGITTTGSTVSG